MVTWSDMLNINTIAIVYLSTPFLYSFSRGAGRHGHQTLHERTARSRVPH